MTSAMSDAEAEAADEGARQAHERPMAAAAMATTTRWKKSRRRERVEPGRDQHAGHAGEQRRQRPREGRHPVGGDAVELGHPGALDDRPHPQADAR